MKSARLLSMVLMASVIFQAALYAEGDMGALPERAQKIQNCLSLGGVAFGAGLLIYSISTYQKHSKLRKIIPKDCQVTSINIPLLSDEGQSNAVEFSKSQYQYSSGTLTLIYSKYRNAQWWQHLGTSSMLAGSFFLGIGLNEKYDII